MYPQSEGDYHYNLLAEQSYKQEQQMQQEIELLKDQLQKLQQTHVSGSLLQFTANDVDGAYFLGVFNVGGIDGLSDELKRIKELGFMPHQLMHMLKVGGNDR